MVGASLCRSFENAGWQVWGTFCSRPRPGLIHLDLAGLKPSLMEGMDGAYAVVASAITNIEKCFLEPDQSRRVNVDGTIRLLRLMKDRGVFPVFLSTDYVFEGTRGNYREEDERNPTTTYGRQKKEVEDFILKNFEGFLLLRLGKVVGVRANDGTFLTEWANKLIQSKPIQAAEDQVCGWIALDDVAEAIRLLIETEKTGVYHLTQAESCSRWELARRLCRHLKVGPELAVPCRINELGLRERRPLNTSLNGEKFAGQTHCQLMSLDRILKKIATACGEKQGD